MIWGDQWLCPCGWHNFFLRTKCRNCGAKKPDDGKTETWQDVLAGLQGKPFARGKIIVPTLPDGSADMTHDRQWKEPPKDRAEILRRDIETLRTILNRTMLVQHLATKLNHHDRMTNTLADLIHLATEQIRESAVQVINQLGAELNDEISEGEHATDQTTTKDP